MEVMSGESLTFMINSLMTSAIMGSSPVVGSSYRRILGFLAIAKKPRILLYDEPTTGLDPIMADVINELIIKVNDSPDITSIVITHDMVSAYKISDRIAVLYEGKIIETGTPDQVRNSTNPVVRQFIEGRSEGPIKIR